MHNRLWSRSDSRLCQQALLPPYHGGRGARANRLQLALQAGVAWTAFTTLLATLDADEAGQTNSRLLLLLPYGIAPAAALGFFAQPLAACLCEQRRRWTKAKERRAAEAAEIEQLEAESKRRMEEARQIKLAMMVRTIDHSSSQAAGI